MYFLQTRTFSRLNLGPHKVHVHPHVDVRKLWHRTISGKLKTKNCENQSKQVAQKNVNLSIEIILKGK